MDVKTSERSDQEMRMDEDDQKETKIESKNSEEMDGDIIFKATTLNAIQLDNIINDSKKVNVFIII